MADAKNGTKFRGKRPTTSDRLTLRLNHEATATLYRLASERQTTRTAIVEAAIMAYCGAATSAPPVKKSASAKLKAIREILES